jgi:catechol 2,3-dioxygenase-like lactoylglutathione lyase family enzyme
VSDEVRFNHVGPHFLVEDVAGAVAFYSSVLGFGVDHEGGAPPQYAVVFRDEVYIHLSRRGPLGYPAGPGAAFVAVAGVDEVWSRVSSTEVDVLEELEDRDYGDEIRFRVFTIRDPGQNVLRIGEPLESE